MRVNATVALWDARRAVLRVALLGSEMVVMLGERKVVETAGKSAILMVLTRVEWLAIRRGDLLVESKEELLVVRRGCEWALKLVVKMGIE